MNNPWFLRLTALALALFLFFSVRADQDRNSFANVGNSMDIIRDVPIEVYYDDENYVVTGVPETVNMTIKGPTNLVQTTKLMKDFALKVDLRSMPMGNHTVQIQHENISEKISVELDPATIEIGIEEKITQSFRVDPEMNDQLLAEDYEVVKMEVDPSTISVTGAKSVVDAISFVKVSVTGEENVEKSFEYKGKVRVLDRDLNKLNVVITPEDVTVKVDVEAYKKEVPISLKPKGDTKDGVTINSLVADEKSVTLYGSRKIIDAIDKLDVDVDVSDISGNGKQSVELTKPKGLIKMSLDTINVNVDVKVSAETKDTKNSKDKEDEKADDVSDEEAGLSPEEESADTDVAADSPTSTHQPDTETSQKKTRKFSNLEIGLKGLEKQFSAKIIKPIGGLTDLTVSGEEKTIDALTESDLEVFVKADDVNLVVEQVLPIFVKVPPGIQYEMNFKDVTVMVEQA